MTTEARYKVQLCMHRNLNDLPDINIPAGYELRHYQPGDGKDWEDIINSAFDRDNMNFYNFMNLDNAYRDDRVLFICKDSKPVATAAAWYKPEWGKNTGYLHMVGTHPNHTGNRLGHWVSLVAMYKMKEDGREDVILLTDDFRIPAIKTYLKLGFEPIPIHENQRNRWKTIFNKINKPELIKKFKGCLEAPLFNDEH